MKKFFRLNLLHGLLRGFPVTLLLYNYAFDAEDHSDMADIDVIEQVRERFSRPLSDYAQRRVLIWHDPDGEFADKFAELAGEGGVCFADDNLPGGAVQCAEVVDGNTFAMKRRVCREQANANFLLYRHRSRGQLEGDWLADVELYADHFQADYISMLLDQLNIADTAETRSTVSRVKAFFAAKTRCSRFSEAMPHARTRAEVLMGVFCVTLEAAAPTVEAIVRAHITNLLDEAQADEVAGEGKRAQSPFDKLRKYGADDAFTSFLQVKLGYAGDPCDVDELCAHLLISALSVTMAPDGLVGLDRFVAAANAQFCLGVVRDWSQQDEGERAALYDACRRIERALNLPQRFDNVGIDALMESDVFPAINESILKSLMNSMSQGFDRGEEALRVAQLRKEMKWYGRVKPFFDCVIAAARMQAFKREHATGFHETDAAAIWRAYTTDWWRMDAEYRAFCLAWSTCSREGNDALDECGYQLATWADNLYTHWFLEQSNACWVNAAAPQWEKRGFVAGVPLQRRFYGEKVEAELSGAKRVVVVVSDALRFEVARQVATQLERDTRGSAQVEAMQATFPSETRFGMAALLPHKSLQYREASDEVYVDGMTTAGLAAREAVLQARRSASRAIQYNDLLKMSPAERKAFAADAQVIYVYHNTIDAAGHGEVSGQDVFDACEDAVRDVVDAVNMAVRNLGASRVLVTADHGFLHTRCDIPECQQASRAEVDGEIDDVERRFLRAAPDATSGVFVNVNMTDIDGGSFTWWAARDCVRIKAAGSRNFVHGGISLQELCVPVVRFRNARAGQKGFVEQQFATLKLLNPTRRITSTIFNLDFYQPEPVDGKVLPCEYELVFTDKMGNNVSDVRRAHADNASPEAADRQVRVKFTLKAGVTWSSTDPYYLVIRNKQTGKTAQTEQFNIYISFAPVDDFGF